MLNREYIGMIIKIERRGRRCYSCLLCNKPFHTPVIFMITTGHTLFKILFYLLFLFFLLVGENVINHALTDAQSSDSYQEKKKQEKFVFCFFLYHIPRRIVKYSNISPSTHWFFNDFIIFMFLRGFFFIIIIIYFWFVWVMDPASFADLFDAISQSQTNILIYSPSKEEEENKNG